MGQRRNFLEPDPEVGRASSRAVGTTVIDTPGMIVAPDGRITYTIERKNAVKAHWTAFFNPSLK